MKDNGNSTTSPSENVNIQVEDTPKSDPIEEADTREFHLSLQGFWHLVRYEKEAVENTVIDEFIQVTADRTDGSWIEFIARGFRSPYQALFSDRYLDITSFSIIIGIPEYVRHTWKADTIQKFETRGISPLELAMLLHRLQKEEIWEKTDEDLYMNPDMVTALLDLGCDPNYIPPKRNHSVGIEILATILEEDPLLISRYGGFRSEEDLYEAVKMLFSRRLTFPTQKPIPWLEGEKYCRDTPTRGDIQKGLSRLFGVAKARGLMEQIDFA